MTALVIRDPKPGEIVHYVRETGEHHHRIESIVAALVLTRIKDEMKDRAVAIHVVVTIDVGVIGPMPDLEIEFRDVPEAEPKAKEKKP